MRSEVTQVPGLVSVIIPTFNQAEYLRDALQCVVDQSYEKWEAIVINNCSTDNTESVVDEYDDSRITLTNFSNSGVIARSRNLGIEMSKGEYIAFLDSDDLWRQDKLERTVAVLSEGSDLVCHAERWFGGNSKDRVIKYGPSSRATYESLLIDGNCISTSATVVRHSVLIELNGFRENPRFVTTEDYDLWLRIAQRGFTIQFIDDVLGSFRRHEFSASSSYQRHLTAELAVIDDHFDANTPTFDPMRRQRRALAFYAAGRACTRGRENRDGLRFFMTSLRLNPTRPKTWLAFSIHMLFSLRRPNRRRQRDK